MAPWAVVAGGTELLAAGGSGQQRADAVHLALWRALARRARAAQPSPSAEASLPWPAPPEALMRRCRQLAAEAGSVAELESALDLVAAPNPARSPVGNQPLRAVLRELMPREPWVGRRHALRALALHLYTAEGRSHDTRAPMGPQHRWKRPRLADPPSIPSVGCDTSMSAFLGPSGPPHVGAAASDALGEAAAVAAPLPESPSVEQALTVAAAAAANAPPPSAEAMAQAKLLLGGVLGTPGSGGVRGGPRSSVGNGAGKVKPLHIKAIRAAAQHLAPQKRSKQRLSAAGAAQATLLPVPAQAAPEADASGRGGQPAAVGAGGRRPGAPKKTLPLGLAKAADVLLLQNRALQRQQQQQQQQQQQPKLPPQAQLHQPHSAWQPSFRLVVPIGAPPPLLSATPAGTAAASGWPVNGPPPPPLLRSPPKDPELVDLASTISQVFADEQIASLIASLAEVARAASADEQAPQGVAPPFDAARVPGLLGAPCVAQAAADSTGAAAAACGEYAAAVTTSQRTDNVDAVAVISGGVSAPDVTTSQAAERSGNRAPHGSAAAAANAAAMTLKAGAESALAVKPLSVQPAIASPAAAIAGPEALRAEAVSIAGGLAVSLPGEAQGTGKSRTLPLGQQHHQQDLQDQRREQTAAAAPEPKAPAAHASAGFLAGRKRPAAERDGDDVGPASPPLPRLSLDPCHENPASTPPLAMAETSAPAPVSTGEVPTSPPLPEKCERLRLQERMEMRQPRRAQGLGRSPGAAGTGRPPVGRAAGGGLGPGPGPSTPAAAPQSLPRLVRNVGATVFVDEDPWAVLKGGDMESTGVSTLQSTHRHHLQTAAEPGQGGGAASAQAEAQEGVVAAGGAAAGSWAAAGPGLSPADAEVASHLPSDAPRGLYPAAPQPPVAAPSDSHVGLPAAAGSNGGGGDGAVDCWGGGGGVVYCGCCDRPAHVDCLADEEARALGLLTEPLGQLPQLGLRAVAAPEGAPEPSGDLLRYEQAHVRGQAFFCGAECRHAASMLAQQRLAGRERVHLGRAATGCALVGGSLMEWQLLDARPLGACGLVGAAGVAGVAVRHVAGSCVEAPPCAPPCADPAELDAKAELEVARHLEDFELLLDSIIVPPWRNDASSGAGSISGSTAGSHFTDAALAGAAPDTSSIETTSANPPRWPPLGGAAPPPHAAGDGTRSSVNGSSSSSSGGGGGRGSLPWSTQWAAVLWVDGRIASLVLVQMCGAAAAVVHVPAVHPRHGSTDLGALLLRSLHSALSGCGVRKCFLALSPAAIRDLVVRRPDLVPPRRGRPPRLPPTAAAARHEANSLAVAAAWLDGLDYAAPGAADLASMAVYPLVLPPPTQPVALNDPRVCPSPPPPVGHSLFVRVLSRATPSLLFPEPVGQGAIADAQCQGLPTAELVGGAAIGGSVERLRLADWGRGHAECRASPCEALTGQVPSPLLPPCMCGGGGGGSIIAGPVTPAFGPHVARDRGSGRQEPATTALGPFSTELLAALGIAAGGGMALGAAAASAGLAAAPHQSQPSQQHTCVPTPPPPSLQLLPTAPPLLPQWPSPPPRLAPGHSAGDGDWQPDPCLHAAQPHNGSDGGVGLNGFNPYGLPHGQDPAAVLNGPTVEVSLQFSEQCPAGSSPLGGHASSKAADCDSCVASPGRGKVTGAEESSLGLFPCAAAGPATCRLRAAAAGGK